MSIWKLVTLREKMTNHEIRMTKEDEDRMTNKSDSGFGHYFAIRFYSFVI